MLTFGLKNDELSKRRLASKSNVREQACQVHRFFSLCVNDVVVSCGFVEVVPKEISHMVIRKVKGKEMLMEITFVSKILMKQPH